MLTLGYKIQALGLQGFSVFGSVVGEALKTQRKTHQQDVIQTTQESTPEARLPPT